MKTVISVTACNIDMTMILPVIFRKLFVIASKLPVISVILHKLQILQRLQKSQTNGNSKITSEITDNFCNNICYRDYV